jgi:hypothetical protein
MSKLVDDYTELMQSGIKLFFSRFVGKCPHCTAFRLLHQKVYFLDESRRILNDKSKDDFMNTREEIQVFNLLVFFSAYCPSCHKEDAIFNTPSSREKSYREVERTYIYGAAEYEHSGGLISPPQDGEYGPSMNINGKHCPLASDIYSAYSDHSNDFYGLTETSKTGWEVIRGIDISLIETFLKNQDSSYAQAHADYDLRNIKSNNRGELQSCLYYLIILGVIIGLPILLVWIFFY